jgi:hypothetical protein
MDDRTKLWLVVYDHARIDVSVCGTEDMAWQTIGEIIMENIDNGGLADITGIAELRGFISTELKRHPDRSEINWEEIAKLYMKSVDWESFEVRETQLIGSAG